jgi:hypothetical protein
MLSRSQVGPGCRHRENPFNNDALIRWRLGQWSLSATYPEPEELGFVSVLPGRMLTHIFEGILQVADVGGLEAVSVSQ